MGLDNQPIDLSGFNCELFYNTGLGKSPSLPFTVMNGAIVWCFPVADQIVTGDYSLILELTPKNPLSDRREIVVNKAFALTSSSTSNTNAGTTQEDPATATINLFSITPSINAEVDAQIYVGSQEPTDGHILIWIQTDAEGSPLYLADGQLFMTADGEEYMLKEE